MMKSTVFSLIVMWLICTATTAPLDGDNHRPEVKIPPYIKKIYNKMSQAMDQGDLNTSLKYLKTIQSVHWLEPITHGKTIQHTASFIVTLVNNIFVPSV